MASAKPSEMTPQCTRLRPGTESWARATEPGWSSRRAWGRYASRRPAPRHRRRGCRPAPRARATRRRFRRAPGGSWRHPASGGRPAPAAGRDSAAAFRRYLQVPGPRRLPPPSPRSDRESHGSAGPAPRPAQDHPVAVVDHQIADALFHQAETRGRLLAGQHFFNSLKPPQNVDGIRDLIGRMEIDVRDAAKPAMMFEQPVGNDDLEGWRKLKAELPQGMPPRSSDIGAMVQSMV